MAVLNSSDHPPPPAMFSLRVLAKGRVFAVNCGFWSAWTHQPGRSDVTTPTSLVSRHSQVTKLKKKKEKNENKRKLRWNAREMQSVCLECLRWLLAVGKLVSGQGLKIFLLPKFALTSQWCGLSKKDCGYGHCLIWVIRNSLVGAYGSTHLRCNWHGAVVTYSWFEVTHDSVLTFFDFLPF